MSARPLVDPRFPSRLRELRIAAGQSLRQLARAVPCSHVHLLDLEHGRKRPSAEMVARLDQVLGSAPELTRLLVKAPEHTTEPEAGAWPAVFGRRDAEALAEALVARPPTAGDALRLAHEWMVAEPPQMYELAAGRQIGTGMVERIERRVHQLRQLDDHLGGADLYQVVTAELATTGSLLREAVFTEPVGRRLLAAVGELAQLAGWVASDAGRHAEAEAIYLAGARAAHSGGDVAGAANNLSSLSYQLANLGQRRDAVLLARSAVRRVDRQAPATVRVLLLEREAWAHARAGDATACDRALEHVEEAYARRIPGDDPAWVYWLNDDEIAVMAGRCWTELMMPLRAVPTLRAATAGYGQDMARESALYLSWLAESLLHAQEVEEAAATALRVLALARQTNSARADARVALLRDRLRPYATAAIREFTDACAR